MFFGEIDELGYQAIIKKSDELLGKLFLHHPESVKHSQQVGIMTQQFMKYLNWDRDSITLGTIAATLHDIGNLRVDEVLLNKGSGISILEHIQLDAHAVHTEAILREEKIFLEEMIRMAAEHHENFDGTGYPKKLKGEQISEGARLLAIVNCYVSILEDRPTRLSRSKVEALEYLKKSEHVFDPVLLNQFLLFLKKND